MTISLGNFEITRLFFALICILSAAHFFGFFFQYFKMPRVIGEITSGIFLGPTFFGHFFPLQQQWLFNGFESESKILATFYWLGLTFLMFVSGFEIQRKVSAEDKRMIIALVAGGTLLPFLAGLAFPSFFSVSSLLGPKGTSLILSIIIGIALAVTSIPVISRIFLDLKIGHTRFAKIVLASATVEDVILWVALAVVTGMVTQHQVSVIGIIEAVSLTILFFVLGLWILPKGFEIGNSLRANFLIRSSVSGYSLLICLGFAAIASLLNINVVFGAFLAGIIVGAMPTQEFSIVRRQIKDLSIGFFVPLYFAIVGLKLDLIHHLNLGLFVGFFLFATFFKTIGVLVAARLAGKNWLSSLNFAVAMNARGGPGIVLATLTFDMGIISESFFIILVSLAILTSLISGYWFNFLLFKGWDLMEEESPSHAIKIAA